MKNSCDCSDKPSYKSLELANRIDKCVDIVSRQEDTIDAQEKTIDIEIEEAERNILDAIEELGEKIDNIKPIPLLAIDMLFESSCLVSRRPELDEQYGGKCVWAYILDSINMPVDADLDPDNVDFNFLFFSDTDEVENKEIVLNHDDAEFSIQGYDGKYEYINEEIFVFKAKILRLVRKK